MGKYFLILMSFCQLWACSLNKDRPEDVFVSKYGNENFSVFRNISLALRGTDERGNKIVFVYDTLDCGFIRVLVDKQTLDVINTELVQIKDNCILNTEEFDFSMIRKFLNYNICYIKVDSTNNVFIKVQNFEGVPNLMQVNDNRFLAGIDMGKWMVMQSNWYISKSK